MQVCNWLKVREHHYHTHPLVWAEMRGPLILPCCLYSLLITMMLGQPNTTTIPEAALFVCVTLELSSASRIMQTTRYQYDLWCPSRSAQLVMVALRCGLQKL